MSSYGTLCTEFYDADKPTAPAAALAYYRRRAEACGGPVLEPMCGSGRFLLELLRAGIDVEGVDAAAAMLEACRRRAQQEQLNPVLHLQSLEALALPRTYRMAFVPSGSIGLLAPSALRAALVRIKDHLAPGSSLLLELVLPAAVGGDDSEAQARHVRVDAQTTIAYHCQSTLASDRASIRYDGCYSKYRDGAVVEVERESLVLNLYEPAAVLALAERCGFDRVKLLPGDEYDSLGESGCVLIEATTPA